MSDELPQGSVRNDGGALPIAQAVALHQAGQLDEAARIYTQVLVRTPDDFDATHLLGVIALQQGRFEAAQRLINAALAIRPNEVSAVGNLGISYLRDGQLEAALQWFDIAVKLGPDLPVALTNAAEVRYHMGRYDEAIPLLEKARAADPASYAACNLLGACLMKIGDEGRAATHFEAATRLRPDEAEAWANLSLALQASGQDGRAGECANRAAQLQPESAAALNALAKAQLEQGRLAQAIENYQRGMSVGAPSVDMILSFANALMANGLEDEAVDQLHRALALDGKNLTVRWALAFGRLKAVYGSEAEVLASRQAFGRSLDEIKAWYENTSGIEAPYRTVGTVQPFLLTYQHYHNLDLLRKYGSLCATFMATLPRRSAPNGPRAPGSAAATNRKLRLGIVSAHVREHSIWTAVTKGWVHQLDRDKFEIMVFHLDRTVDQETRAAMASVAHFDNQPKDLGGWVDAIAARELDIALFPETGSDPLTLKLAALRFAPLQAVTWGHPETSGLPTMDLYISGRAFEPPGAENNYSEKLAMLPSFGVYVEPLALPHGDPDLESLRLPTDRPLLLCPGQPFKYAPRYDHVWVEIAKGLRKRGLFRHGSAGHLVFFRSHNQTADRMLEKRLRAAFAGGGVDFDAHVSIIPFLPHERFFGLMRRSTLMLDTLGFSGFNTALQGIECELPVLAFEGDFLRSRLASGIMRELDLPDLVATGEADFVQKAVSLARDPGKIQELRAQIGQRRAKLFRDPAPIRALERCLIEMSGGADGPTKPADHGSTLKCAGASPDR
jgi:predicted O-linked N-acetylglucosamine transferase (SPINDLY family)